jgi:hypothetical protein
MYFRIMKLAKKLGISKHSKMTLNMLTFSITVLSITTLNIITFIITTLSITTLNVMKLIIAKLSIQHSTFKFNLGSSLRPFIYKISKSNMLISLTKKCVAFHFPEQNSRHFIFFIYF